MIKLTEGMISEAQQLVGEATKSLATRGIKRVDMEIPISLSPKPIEITSYWVGDMIRVDIKL